MTPIAKKTKQSALLVLELIVGALMMVGAMIVLPIAVFSIDASLLENIYIWGFVLMGMLFFCLVGFFGFVRPYLLFRKLPDVQAETDGTYLYIHSTKEARIPLSEMEGAYLDAEIPYVMSSEFIIHLLSEQYGKVIIDVPKHGKYKLYYISRAQDVPSVIAALAEREI